MGVDDDPLAVPWFPDALGEQVRQHIGVGDTTDAFEELRANWRYVVVEEVAGGIAELHSWPWPLVDQTGRLSWPKADRDAVIKQGIPAADLQTRVYSSGLMRRVKAGDTFAVRRPTGAGADGCDAERSAGQSAGQGADPLRAILGEVVLDISPDAREAAKISYFGSSAAIFHEDDAVAGLLEEAAEHRSRRTATELAVGDAPSPEDDADGRRG